MQALCVADDGVVCYGVRFYMRESIEWLVLTDSLVTKTRLLTWKENSESLCQEQDVVAAGAAQGRSFSAILSIDLRKRADRSPRYGREWAKGKKTVTKKK